MLTDLFPSLWSENACAFYCEYLSYYVSISLIKKNLKGMLQYVQGSLIQMNDVGFSLISDFFMVPFVLCSYDAAEANNNIIYAF